MWKWWWQLEYVGGRRKYFPALALAFVDQVRHRHNSLIFWWDKIIMILVMCIVSRHHAVFILQGIITTTYNIIFSKHEKDKDESARSFQTFYGYTNTLLYCLCASVHQCYKFCTLMGLWQSCVPVIAEVILLKATALTTTTLYVSLCNIRSVYVHSIYGRILVLSACIKARGTSY